MPIRNRHKPGDWLYVCQRCGFTRYASQTRMEWTGLRVCSECWEPRHPQDFVRGRKDDIAPPFSQPPTDIFLEPNEVIYTGVLSQDGSTVLAPSGEVVVAES
jgi:hypothetical protein